MGGGSVSSITPMSSKFTMASHAYTYRCVCVCVCVCVCCVCVCVCVCVWCVCVLYVCVVCVCARADPGGGYSPPFPVEHASFSFQPRLFRYTIISIAICTGTHVIT